MYSDSLYPYRVPSYDALDLRLPPLNLDDFPDTLPPPPVPRISGNLDPTTGIFYHMPENPRIRTTQACDSCRSRKAKCSGDHPSCARCVARGLLCEYSKDIKPRAPNRGFGRPRGRPPGRQTGDSPSQRPSHERAAKKRRRNSTFAHLTNSAKRFSLPTPLDLDDMNLISMNASDGSYDAYDKSDPRSRRSSYNSFDGGHDDFDSHRQFFDDAGKPLPLESGYALQGGGMHNVDPALMHIDLALRPQSFGVPSAHPTAPLGFGMELLLAPQQQSLGPRDYFRPGSGSSSSTSGSSDNSSVGPDSAIEGGFPLFHQGHHAPHSVSPQSPHRQYRPQTHFEPSSTFFDSGPSSNHSAFDMQGLQGVSNELLAGQYGYVDSRDTTLFSQYQQQVTSHVSFTPTVPNLVYPTWGTKAHDYTLKPLPSVDTIGWVEPPSMPLPRPVPMRDMPEVVMPVPSRALMQRGVSGLSVVIPESSERLEVEEPTSEGSSSSSKDESVPSSAASPSTSASSAASSPLSSVPEDIDVPGEEETSAGRQTKADKGVAPPSIGRASSSGQVESGVSPRGTGSSRGGRKRGRTVSSAGDV